MPFRMCLHSPAPLQTADSAVRLWDSGELRNPWRTTHLGGYWIWRGGTGKTRGAQTAGMSIPFMWNRRPKYCTPRIFCCPLPWSRAMDLSMWIDVVHMYIRSLRCKDHNWHLETPSPFKRAQIHHILLTPRWQKATNIFAFEHFSFISKAY